MQFEYKIVERINEASNKVFIPMSSTSSMCQLWRPMPTIRYFGGDTFVDYCPSFNSETEAQKVIDDFKKMLSEKMKVWTDKCSICQIVAEYDKLER